MSTILAYTSPALGHLFPMTPLLLELRSRGHRVHVRTLAGQVDRMESLGLEASAMDARVEAIENVDWKAGNARAALGRSVATFVARGEYDGPDLEQRDRRAAARRAGRRHQLLGCLVAAEASGLPFVTFSPYTPPIRSVGTPPFGPGFKPLPGLLGRLRDGLLRPVVMGVAERVMGPRIAELRAARGLPPVGSADEFFRRAPLMLVTTAEPFEYHHEDWGDDIVMIGASAWEPPARGRRTLARRRRPPAGAGDDVLGVPGRRHPGAYGARGAGRRAGLRGRHDAGRRPRRPRRAGERAGRAVPARTARSWSGPPSRSRTEAWAAPRRRSSHGVPVCVVPFGRDQLEVARRVEVSGSGTRLPARRLERRAAAGGRARGDGAAPRAPVGWPRATAPRAGWLPRRTLIEQRFLGAEARPVS